MTQVQTLRVFALVAALTMSALPAQVRGESETAGVKIRDFVVCKSPGSAGKPGKTVRTLRVYESPEFGCRATYSKINIEKIVGASRSSSQCGGILEGIKKNLEASSWSCKRASTAGMLQSSQAKAEFDAELTAGAPAESAAPGRKTDEMKPNDTKVMVQ